MNKSLNLITIESFPPLPELCNEDTEYHRKQEPQLSPISPSGSSTPSSLSMTSFTDSEVPIVSPLSPDLKPVPWIWKCHLCGRRYPLGVTRRCLVDGHYFCAGQETVAHSHSRKKRTRACTPCASEFDYIAWGKHMDWKKGRHFDPKGPAKQGCWQCSYPNECRQRASGRQSWQAAVGVAIAMPETCHVENAAQTSDKPSKQRLEPNFEERSTSDDYSAGISMQKAESKKKCKESSGSKTSRGGHTAQMIERIIKNAEERVAQIEALTRPNTKEKKSWEDEGRDLAYQYLVPVIDFVHPRR